MITFDGKKVLVENAQVIIGMSQNEILSALRIKVDKVIQINGDLAYFTIENVMMGDLSGKCQFLITREKLAQISFIPSLKEYIKELKQVTRQGLYACVDKGYQSLRMYLDNADMNLKEERPLKVIYTFLNLKITLSIDNNRESVSVILEEING